MSHQPNREPIAIVGVSALFPGSTDATGFWRDILAGRDLLTDVPATHWRIEDYYDADPAAPDKTYARRGGFLSPIDFDALGFGIPPSTIPATDTSQLLALVVAQAVLQDAARGQFETMDRSRISVILGVTSAQELLFSMVSRLQRPVWVKALREAGLPEDEVQAACERIAAHYVPWQEATFPGLLGNVVAGRIANRLDLGGTNCVTDAACASTFSALSMAINELQLGNSDLVISGGVDTLNDIFMYMCFSKTPALSPSGDCRPFSDRADGTMLGEGLGMVALKRLSDAERDGDRVYAVIRGLGTSSDGRSKSVYAPVSEGQAVALRRAYALAGYGPQTVELVEAHGTGTKAGDVAEFEGLRSVFAPEAPQRTQWCALGSVKSQIGHTKAAAGAAGLFKAVMALHHKVLPPTVKVDTPNPKLAIDASPFYLNTRARPWIRASDHPRRASVSAFGFGGSNFHVTVEEYAGPAPRAERLPTQAHELVVLTAKSADALIERADALRDATGTLARLARDSRDAWDVHASHRLALVAATREELQERLAVAAQRIAARPDAGFALPDGSAYGLGAREGKVAMLFPGQGSQYLGMGADVAMQFDAARAPWDRAADLALDADAALHDVVFPRPVFTADAERAQRERLTATHWAQPALGCASVALLAVLRELGVEGELVAGHSFGELVALHAAGTYGEQDLLRIARRRGELMRDASAQGAGAMAAVTAPLARVTELLARHAPALVVANHNAPEQVVVSGPGDAIAALERAAAGEGVTVQRLPVATAFHSALVADSCAPLAAFLDGVALSTPTMPVYANTTATPYATDPSQMRATLARQLAEPVRFVEMIEAMYAAGARTFVEVGPGAVLSGLVAASLKDRPHAAIALDRKGRNGLETLLVALARLAAEGVLTHPERLFADVRIDAGPRAPGKLSLPINGSNVGKPYPPTDPAALPPPNPPRAAAPVVASQPHSDPGVEAVSSRTEVVSAAWLAAFQEAQQQTADAHAAYQRAMAESHAQYLKLAESALHGLTALMTGAPSSIAPDAVAAPLMPVAAPTIALKHAIAPTTPSIATTTVPTPATPAPVAAAPATLTPASRSSVEDLAALVLHVVAEKTGYPTQMLDLDMDLEGDLGIDSIKRVEILAAVEERGNFSGKLDRSRIGTLHSLREILASLLEVAPPSTQSPAVDLAGTAVLPEPEGNLAELLLQIVSEKTGYPADMLNLDMDLEGDLGIDSIKRVEILATVEERGAIAGQFDRARLGALHTLREILGSLQSEAPSGVPSVASEPAVAPASVAASAPAVVAPLAAADLASMLLQVVSEKTGYPADMLNLEMDLESDLGIDSIKRVEILAAVEERLPALPSADRSRLTTLNSLGEIVAHLSRGEPQSQLLPQATVALVTEAPASVPASTSVKACELGRYGLERIAAPATSLAQPGLLGGGDVFIVGGDALDEALATTLRKRGVAARSVAVLPDGACRCIYLGGLRAVDVDSAIAVNREAFAVAHLIAPQMQNADALFVTVQDTGGAFGTRPTDAPRAWLAGLPALVKTAALEWPKASLKAIDLERGGRDADALATAIADELLRGGGEMEVGLSAFGERSTLRSVARAVHPSTATIGAGDVVVVSGGARGVTAGCIIEWAKECRARFVLLGRTPLEDEPGACAGIDDEKGLKRVLFAAAQAAGEAATPAQLNARVDRVRGAREIRATLAAIGAAGAEVRYEAVAVDDAVALARVLERVRSEWGPIAGVVHAAGVLADRRIADKTTAQFDTVFGTKVNGLRALLAATEADPLKLLCVFSSVSARCGNTGQADYAMANEVLSKVAWSEARRRPGLRVKALCWGPWEGGMVTPHLKERFAALGVPMIPLAAGARMFADEMRDASADEIELVLGGEPRPEALLSEGADARVQAVEVVVARASHEYLEGHAVNGMPIVPVVLVAEWMARAARSFRPGLALAALHDVKVLKGIRLGGFENGGDRLRVEATSIPGARGVQLAMSVHDARGTLNYTARAELTAEPPSAEQGTPQIALDAWSGERVYEHMLFHRGRFELIDRVHGISDDGIGATVHGVAAAGWNGESWQLDVAALDGGLQLACVHGQRMLGGPTLPTTIDELRCFAGEPVTGPVTATAYRRTVGPLSTTTDILLCDSDGRRFAEMLGVQNHALPRG